ncbi:MAG: stage IV sporulation protein A [Clostridia bacterium]|nr:stage IV sporulation protein A [Clostridia bacterium]
MENYSVYRDIANRTGGDIYIGVVGPVRTGKSTFIKRFMEVLVLPQADGAEKSVMVDELPQAAAGKTVMTTEPKFVPAKAAKISVAKGAEARVRLVDCVGFAVDGASGFEEDGAPRLVKTPWQDAPMPFEQAAAFGTEKVIREHSTVGVLVTTDGSVTGLPRENYEGAEARAVQELKSIKKPFVIVLNCKNPEGQAELKNQLESKYEAPVVALNVEMMGEAELCEVLQKALFEFPVMRIDVKMPKWLQALPEDNETVEKLLSTVKKAAHAITMRDCLAMEQLFDEDSGFINPDEIRMDLGKGNVEITIDAKRGLFYETLSDACEDVIEDDLALMRYVQGLSRIKRGYDKVKDAFKEAEESGYGIVYPDETDYNLEKPQLVKKGVGYGVQFRAKAPSYHIVKVNVMGSVNPIIGTKQQGEEFVAETLKNYDAGEEVWETNIFGKSLRSLMGDELSGKTNAMPVELRKKMRRTVSKIVNDGKGNVICIVF